MFGQHGAGPGGRRCRSSTSYTEHGKSRGSLCSAFSEQEVSLQRKFVEQVPVSYPLLTLQGEVPSFYRDIARCPAIFLIDRRGQLQPAPGPDQPFESVAAAVDGFLNGSR